MGSGRDDMTIAMPDSIRVADLPPGYPAYLGYVDGDWPTAPELAARFPGAHILELTVTGKTLHADGCDIEPGNLTPSSGAAWCRDKLGAEPAARPVAYASVSAMPDVISDLNTHMIYRAQVRLLSAHYGAGEHICGPATCDLVKIPMDGTQWTDAYPGTGGRLIDMSALTDTFFGTPPPPAAPPFPYPADNYIGTARPDPRCHSGCYGGPDSTHTRTWQDQMVRRGWTVTVDGCYGPQSQTVCRQFQIEKHLTADGLVGPQTWAATWTAPVT